MPILSGVKIRHISGPDLKTLEDKIESLPYIAEIKAINRVGSNWYIHFLVPKTHFDDPKVVKEKTKETKTIKTRSK